MSSPGALETDESEERAQGNSPGIRGRLPRQAYDGLTGTKAEAAFGNDPAIEHHFHPPRPTAPVRDAYPASGSSFVGRTQGAPIAVFYRGD